MIYKKSWKYILIWEEDSYWCRIDGFYRPKALKDFSDVQKNYIGGYVQGYHNLSQFGDCWIYDEAKVYKNASVTGNAIVYGEAIVSDNAKVYGESQIHGHAIIKYNAEVFDDARVYGAAVIHSNAVITHGDFN